MENRGMGRELPEPPVARDDDAVELVFTNLEEFVSGYLTQIVHRRLNRASAVWCPDWWRHPEALARLAVLWRAFEFLRMDQALGLSMWWLHHADPHLRALMNPTHGPFVACDARDGHSPSPPEPLPSSPVPRVIRDHPAFALSRQDLEELRDQRAARAAKAVRDTEAESPEGLAKEKTKEK